MAFGAALRKAREAKGLSASEVAASTRMMVQIVEDLEREEFGRIAAVIYGKGFIKLYAEAVGLDPKPLIDEYAALAGPARAGLGGDEVPPPRPPGTKPGAAPLPKVTHEVPPEATPEPDLFSTTPARRQSGPKTEPAPQVSESLNKRVKAAPTGLRILKDGLAGAARATATAVAQATHKSRKTLGRLKAALMQRLEGLHFGDAPLRTIAAMIGIVVLLLLLLSGLSRWFRSPPTDEPYPLATEIPEPYFE